MPRPLIQDSMSGHTLAATQAAMVACECTGPKSLSGQLAPSGRTQLTVFRVPNLRQAIFEAATESVLSAESIFAGLAKSLECTPQRRCGGMVDATDLKSVLAKAGYGFESHHRHPRKRHL